MSPARDGRRQAERSPGHWHDDEFAPYCRCEEVDMFPAAQAVAMGEQMHAAMFDQARESVDGVLEVEGIDASETDRLHIEIGIGAGIHAAMRVLVDMGLLAAVEP